MSGTSTTSERQALESEARRALGAAAALHTISALTDRQLHEAVLLKRSPGFRLEGRSDDAVKAAYDFAMKLDSGAPEGAVAATRRADQARQEVDEDVDAKLAELERKRQSAWRQPEQQSEQQPSQSNNDADASVDAKLAELERKRRTASQR